MKAESRQGNELMSRCDTCDNALRVGDDFDPKTMTQDDYLATAVAANHWTSPTECDVCAGKKAKGQVLHEAHAPRLTSLQHYWDPQGPVQRLAGEDGKLRLRELSLDDIEAVISEYDRRLRQVLDKIAFERERELVDYSLVKLRHLPANDVKQRQSVVEDLLRRSQVLAQHAENEAARGHGRH